MQNDIQEKISEWQRRNQKSDCYGEQIWKHFAYVFLFQGNNLKNLEKRLKKDQFTTQSLLICCLEIVII